MKHPGADVDAPVDDVDKSAERRDAVLRRMLKTPRKPRKVIDPDRDPRPS